MAKSKVQPETEHAWRQYLARYNDKASEPMDPEVEKMIRLGFCAGYQERWTEEQERERDSWMS
jgi:hypothetical protein